ncbi:hypothetical protein EZS27_031973, partial [termite gut metagenome]
AQNYDDDLYYIPEKALTKKEVKTTATTIYATPQTTIVIGDRQTRKIRDVDEYNRRYGSSSDQLESNGNTLYIEEKKATDRGDGEWINGFNGSQDDYEYAGRIIRFRNPRYAVHVSSPLYWEVVYGLNSWDWNVYTDGWYAYAFPAFPNRLWWDWRFNSFGTGWGSYYSWNYAGSWGGYYHPYPSCYYPYYYGGGWHHSHNSGYWARNVYYNDRRPVYGSNRTSAGSSVSSRRSATYTHSHVRRIDNGTIAREQNDTPGAQSRRSSSSSIRVAGTKVNSGNERQGVTTRSNNPSSRTTTYTRPGSTRNADVSESKTNESTYTPGSSAASPSRRSSNESSRSSYGNTSSSPSSSRQSGYSSSGSSSRSSSSYSSSSSSPSGSRSSSSGSSSGGRRR